MNGVAADVDWILSNKTIPCVFDICSGVDNLLAL